MQLTDRISILEFIIDGNRTIEKGIILTIPTETEHQLFSVHVIIQDSCNHIFIFLEDITSCTLYDEHFQAYHSMKV